MSEEIQNSAALRTPRILLIDTLRGAALIAMASYHFTWDLGFFGYIDSGTATQGLWKLYARCIASTFLFLVGVSLVLAHRPQIRWSSFAKRLGMVAAAAVVISVGTYVAMPDEWIFFGILHNITVSSLIALAFLSLPPALTGIVSLMLIVGMVLDNWVAPGLLSFEIFDSRWFAWIGFAETTPRSNDYVPIFPWLAAVLAGVAAAGFLRRSGGLTRLANVQKRPNILTKAGQHSLIFYLLHQPILIGLVYLTSLVVPAPAPDLVKDYTNNCTPACMAQTNDAALCERFCSCTATGLANQSLLGPMYKGEISSQTDERVQSVVQECSRP